MSLSVRDKFWVYHAENPHIYKAFVKKALIATRYKSKWSARAIFQILRWETMIAGSGEYKIWDHASPYYARLFEHQYPEHKGFFRKKRILPTDEVM